MNQDPNNRANRPNLPPNVRGPVTPRPPSRQGYSSGSSPGGHPGNSRFSPAQRPDHGPRYGPKRSSPGTPHQPRPGNAPPGNPRQQAPITRKLGSPPPPQRSSMGTPHNPRMATSSRLRLNPKQDPRPAPEKPMAPQQPIHSDPVSDQRRYQRMKMIMGMVCRRKGKKDTNVFTDDVSAGGIKFSSTVQLERGEEVFLDVPIGNGEYKSIPGKIAWVKKTALCGIEGGIEFDRMDNATRREWEKFIERNAEPE